VYIMNSRYESYLRPLYKCPDMVPAPLSRCLATLTIRLQEELDKDAISSIV
jgi:hypothetical protein